MYNILWNALFKKRVFIHSGQIAFLSNLASIRKVVPFKETLTYRFLQHFEKSCDIANLPLLQHNKNKSKAYGKVAALAIDQKLCTHAANMTNNEILQYLTHYISKISRKLTELEFYHISRAILSHKLNQLSSHEIVQFMYLVALKNKSYDTSKLLEKCLIMLTEEKLQTLSLDDLLIICNATFKCSTLINNKPILNVLEKSLYENLNLLNDPALFITLVKTLRHNECQNEELLNTISATIFFNETYKAYNFAALCHILALYADYHYYNEELLKLFLNLATEQLSAQEITSKDSYVTENIRAKDIKRFLWGYSLLGYQLPDKDLVLFENKILERIKFGHFEDDSDSLLDCTFYLWMLNYQPVKLLPFCKNKVNVVKGNRSRSKNRANQLLVCMQLENIGLYKEFGHKADIFKFDTKKQVAERPVLRKVFDALKRIMNEFDVNRLEFEYQIPHINIVGITGYRKNIYKTFIVEILDDVTKLKNCSGKMNGMMQLKARLLYKLDERIILIEAEDIKDFNSEELDTFLRSELAIIS